MTFIIIILTLFTLNYANATTCVDILFTHSQTLKTIKTTAEATTEVEQLRRGLSSKPIDRDATDEERKLIIQSIVATETAAMLIDGAYDFKFNRTAYVLPVGVLSEREQIHYGWIFCLARTAQLLAENPAFDQTDITLLLGRDVRSRHMPAWMREVFQQTLRHNDWTSYVKPYLAVKTFALTETRSEERKIDQKSRLQFTVTITTERLSEASEMHKSKGIPFAEPAFLKPGTYIFDAYAISPDGACMFYGSQGSYGYFDRSDFGEQIVDNLDNDPVLEDLTKNSIAHDYTVWHGIPPRGSAHTTVGKELGGPKTLTEIVAEMSKPLDVPENATDDEKAKANDLRIEGVKSQIKQGLMRETIKKIVSTETTTPLFKTGFQGFVTYVDLIAYLNLLNIYTFSKNDKSNVLTLHSPNLHVAYLHGRTTFLQSTPDKDHVSRLVRRDDTTASLFEYIKAKAHEDKRGTKINDGYQRSWM